MEQKNNSKTASEIQDEFNLQYAYLLDEESGELQTIESLIINKDKYKPIKKPFTSGDELEKLVLKNYNFLFGESLFLIELGKLVDSPFLSLFHDSKIILDFRNKEKPCIYLVVTKITTKEIQEEFFWTLTQFFQFIRKKDEFKQDLALAIYDVISPDMELQQGLEELSGKPDLIGLFLEMIKHRFYAMVLTENYCEYLPELNLAYPETWGKLLRVILIKKFAVNGATICTVIPQESNPLGKISKSGVKEKKTEEAHLEGVTDTVRSTYIILQTALQEMDYNLVFNPQNYYIALRKDKNISFFLIKKKKITIVVKLPESKVRELIKHHEIIPLKDTVQSFYNGESCSFVVENPDYLEEITELFKIMLFGEETSSSPENETEGNNTKVDESTVDTGKKEKVKGKGKDKKK